MATRRTSPAAEGRLFLKEEFPHGWSISAQADAAGYQCSPRKRLETLEEYDAVEVKIDGPEHWPVDPTTLGLPEHIAAKFTQVEAHSPSLGLNITQAELAVIRQSILFVAQNPNAGIPRGSVVWGDRDVFHGGSADAIKDICANGIDMARSHGGYFGRAFYVADTADLAISNYADFSADDDIPGGVVHLRISNSSRILDLRNAADTKAWDESGLVKHLHREDFAMLARQAGIDGIYDRSVGGLAIYNPNVLKVVGPILHPELDNFGAPSPRLSAFSM